jgi:hypothetical protein
MLKTTRTSLITLLMIQTVSNACLNGESLRFLGITPVPAHQPQLKSICSQTYSQFRSCVDEKSFDEAIKAGLDVSVRQESAKYSYLHEELENVVGKFKKLTAQTEKNGNFTNEVMNQLVSVKNLIPENVDRLRKQILRSAHNCFAVQSHIAIGSLCLLSSEAATDYVSNLVGEGHSNEANSNRDIQIRESLALKVTTEAADEIFTACMPLVQASCIYRKINKVLALFEGRPLAGLEDECSSHLVDCLNNNGTCQPEIKNKVLETLFKPFSSHLVGSDEIASISGVLRSKINGFWEKGITQLYGTYSHLFNITAAPLEKLTSLTHKSYQYVFKLLGRSEAQLNTTDPITFKHSTPLVPPLDHKIQFIVATDGRDVVADGVASGVYIQNSPLIPALVGLAFVLVQMFV